MRESVKESIFSWLFTLFGAGVVVLVFSAVVAVGKCAAWDRVDDFGGQGQPCYPNRTCDGDLTCYSLSKDVRDAITIVRKGTLCFAVLVVDAYNGVGSAMTLVPCGDEVP